MFKRLRNRLLLVNMTIISIVVIAAFVVIYFITHTNIQKENQNKLDSIQMLPRVALLNPGLPEPQTNDPDTRISLVRIPVDYSLSFTILVDNGGLVMDFFSYLDLPDETYYQIAENIWSTGKKNGAISFENRKWQYQVSSFNRVMQRNGEPQVVTSDGLSQIAFLDITDSSKTLTQLLITLGIAGVALLFVLFGVSYHFANRSIRPLEVNWEKQKQFVADASHELKTPLAIINANADALLTADEETVASQKKWIDYIRSEVGRMGKLVNDMLYLARVEDASEVKVPFDMSNTISDVVASMEAIIFEKGINLTQSIEPGIVVRGDGEKIRQAVLILLDNAIKYSDQNGNIDIILKKSKGHAVFSIRNTGECIPEDKLSFVFDRFYRCDPSRSQGAGGYGLGLTIAKTIIERSRGSIYVESTGNSTTFTFVLKT